MLLASKAGGYMDNAVLAVDGGRNMVCNQTEWGGKLMNRSQGSMTVYRCLMRRTSYEPIRIYPLGAHRYQQNLQDYTKEEARRTGIWHSRSTI